MKMNIEDIKKKYRLKFDHHTHTIHSKVGPYYHGKGNIIDNARAAAKRGLDSLAITDHGPFDFYGIDMQKLPQMRRDISLALAFDKFDFVNAGYHYVPKCHMIHNLLAFHLPHWPGILQERLRRQNTARIVKALKSNDIQTLTHPGDKAFIDEHAVAKACEETDTLVEINARHKHPNVDDLKIYKQYDVKFVISSDAHRPKFVGRYAESLALAMEAGIDPERIVNIQKR